MPTTPGQVLAALGIEQVDSRRIQPQRGGATGRHPAHRIQFDTHIWVRICSLSSSWASSASLRGDVGRRLIGHERVLLIAQPFGDVDGDVESNSPAGLVRDRQEMASSKLPGRIPAMNNRPVAEPQWSTPGAAGMDDERQLEVPVA